MDHNIIVKNQLGSGSSGKNKLSAKKSIQRNNNTKKTMKFFKKGASMAGKGLNSAGGGSSFLSLSGATKKAGIAGAIVATLITIADKVISFGINLKEAKTGEQVTAHNSRTTLKTITSFGTNYASGWVNNELFNKKIVLRENYGLDYGREIYSLQVEGTKNKRV